MRAVLVDEYRRMPRSNRPAPESFAFSLVDNTREAEFEEIASHARDRLDPGRPAFVLGLGRLKRHRERITAVLLEALHDSDFAYLAVESLGRLGVVEALSAIRPFAETPDRTKRSVAMRAIARLEHRANKSPPTG